MAASYINNIDMFSGIPKMSLEDAGQMLEYLPAQDFTYNEWITMLYALKNEYGEEAWDIFDKWCANDHRYNYSQNKRFWDDAREREPGRGRASIKKFLPRAVENGYQVKRSGEIGWLYQLRKSIKKQFGEGAELIDTYHYCDKDGNVLYTKYRAKGGTIKEGQKAIRYIRILDDFETIEYKNDSEYVLYNLKDLMAAIKEGYPVVIVEGEKDCNTLRGLDGFYYAATTSGGSTSWRDEFASIFKCANVIILRDNDQEGEKYARTICRSIKGYADSVRVVNISNIPKGDVTDFLEKENGTVERLLDEIEKAEKEVAPWYYKGKINPGILADYIEKQEHYFLIRTDRKDSIYVYKDGFYQLSSRNTLKAIIQGYIPKYLRTNSLVNNVCDILLASEEHVRSYRDVLCNEYVFNFKNGLLDSRTDKFSKHTPDVITTMQYSFDYEPENEFFPVFNKFFTDFMSCDGVMDKEKGRVLQEVGGMLISPDCMGKTKRLPILLSHQGNSGKSVFINLLRDIIGEQYVEGCSIKDLTPDSRFIFGALHNTRLIACPDESRSLVKNSEYIKKLTGFDMIKIEKKGQDVESARYRGGMIVACNGLPIFDDDKGTQISERFLIIPCDNHIEKDKRDPELLQHMQAELPAIFNFFYIGYKSVVNRKYKFSSAECCEKQTEEYRLLSDPLYMFIQEQCEVTKSFSDIINRTDFDNKFSDWLYRNGYDPVKKSEMKLRMESIGISCAKRNEPGKHDNSYHYMGIKWV